RRTSPAPSGCRCSWSSEASASPPAPSPWTERVSEAQLHRITELTDPALDDYLRMTDVKLRSRVEVDRGLFMAESFEVISRAMDAGTVPRSFLMSEKWLAKFAPLYERFPDVPVLVGEAALLAQLSGFHLHRGARAAMQRTELPGEAELLDAARTVAVPEAIVDHKHGQCST